MHAGPYDRLRHVGDLVTPWAAVSPPSKPSHAATVTLGDGHLWTTAPHAGAVFLGSTRAWL